VAQRKAIQIRELFDGLPLVPGIKLLLSHSRSEPELAAVLAPLAPLATDQQITLFRRQAALRRGHANISDEVVP
jgi:4-hydroxy-tetrahydrodipicolinate synthase